MRTGADIAAPMIQFLIDGEARMAKRTGPHLETENRQLNGRKGSVSWCAQRLGFGTLLLFKSEDRNVSSFPKQTFGVCLSGIAERQ
ncbi:hypothetical protein SPHS6_03828 [Sphingobium sp. S6]|nr:hypothetical protein SPHS6_03828 [Sphingobium sp. S6]CAD7342057.1 hypothetical protein SPHS8_03839 [Sphingobium sp. S8]